MGTSAFDRAWGEDPPAKKTLSRGRSLAKPADSFDALWGDEPAAPRESLKLDVKFPAESTHALPHNRPDRSGDFEAAAPAALGLVATAGQAVPGVEALQAGVRSLVRGQPYSEALKDIRGVTDEIPMAMKLLAQAPAIAAGAKVLPFSPAKSGALIGAADQALGASPDQSVLGIGEDHPVAMRALRTLVGAGFGTVAGKLPEMGATSARVAKAPQASKLLKGLDEARAAKSGPLYAAAEAEGAASRAAGTFGTPKVKALFQRPEVAEIADGLSKLDEFQGVPLESEKMLDSIYKVLSDQKGDLATKLQAVAQRKLNLGRFDKNQVQSIQNAILDAAEEAGMKSYRPAVQAFAEGSNVEKAAVRGGNAIRSRLNRNLPLMESQRPRVNELRNPSPEAFEEYVRKKVRSPEAREALEQGILANTKGAFRQSVRKSGIPALTEAPDLLRIGHSKTQLAQDRALRALLLGIAAQ